VPGGPLRVTNADALPPPLLAGLGIAELPEFIAAEYLKDGRLEHLLKAWSMTQGGLYFVTSPHAVVRSRSEYCLTSLRNISVNLNGAGHNNFPLKASIPALLK